MDRARLTFLFHRYVNNECTNEEKSEFFALVESDQYQDELAVLIDKLWIDVPEKKIARSRSQEIMRDILRPADKVTPIRVSYFTWGRIAASFVLVAICGGGLFYFLNSGRMQRDEVAQLRPARAETSFIKLPDGSTVILNAGSKLDFPRSFENNAREVSLTGEAYFDIAHDPERPFIVHTGQLMTTVLGTAFNIRAYPDQSDIVVTVTRGKVKVSDENKVLGIINPDQQITFNRTREFILQQAVDTHEATAWIEKDIFFDDVTIDEAVDQLEKRFNISISLLNSPIAKCRFTATFVKGEDITQILRIISDFNNAQLVEGSSGKFVIEGGQCAL